MLKCHCGLKLVSQDFSKVRFHIQQESDIPASTQLYNLICFAIAARHYPPGHRLAALGNSQCRLDYIEIQLAKYTDNLKQMGLLKRLLDQVSM